MDTRHQTLQPLNLLMRHRRDKVSVGDNALDAVAKASGMLRSIGFRLAYTSMQSEACYYELAGWNGVIRIAAHRHGRTMRRSDLLPVVATVTFGKNQGQFNDDEIERATHQALGRYFMRRLTALGAGQPEAATEMDDRATSL